MNRLNTRRFLLIALILSGGVFPWASAARQTPEAALAKAREDLRISRITCDRISSELERLKSSGKAAPQTIQDYETYLSRVEAIRDENKSIVEQMEQAMAHPKKHRASPPVEEPKPEITIPEEQGGDKLAALDRELNESLQAFDEMLLKEMERIKTASASRMTGLAREAAEAAKKIEEDLQDSSSAKGSGQEEEAGKPGESRTEPRSDETAREKGRQEGGFESGGTGAGDESTRASKTGERESEQDDDIVARQLREAAEKETDPELKEKLWKEYEAYKASRRKTQERTN
jgi:hypothetical protein